MAWQEEQVNTQEHVCPDTAFSNSVLDFKEKNLWINIAWHP